MTRGVKLAVTSGFLAASGSVLGKYAMSEDHFLGMIHMIETVIKFLISSFINSPVFLTWFSSIVAVIESNSIVFRIILFISMVIMNTLMWTTFSKAMNVSSSAVIASAINTAFNFIFTAIYGSLLFGEVLTLKWFLGSSLMIIGVILIKSDETKEGKENKLD